MKLWIGLILIAMGGVGVNIAHSAGYPPIMGSAFAVIGVLVLVWYGIDKSKADKKKDSNHHNLEGK
jgi:arginine exporter protein ArgO